MKDRFKFRVVYYNDVEKKYFIFEPDLISADGTARAYAYGESGADEYYDTVTLNQCTGLKDKNGRLIYEGDIVRLFCDEFENIHTVKFGDFAMYSLDFQTEYEKGSTAVYGYYLGGLKYPIPLSISLDTSGMQIEVIGNIYENKELLNDSN